jgi:hypothetical protein
MEIGTVSGLGSGKRDRRYMLATAVVGFGLLASGLAPAIAQEATPAADGERPRANQPHPAHIHAGSCANGELGDIVAPLADATAPRGRGAGNEDATTAATSFTVVPLPLDAILAADHAVNVHLSAEQIDVYIACGELGGPLNDDGTLVVGLREQSNSRFSGIAFLAPGADGASTNVSVFVADDRSRNRDGVGGANAAGTPSAVGGAQDATNEDDLTGDGGAEGTPVADDGY